MSVVEQESRQIGPILISLLASFIFIIRDIGDGLDVLFQAGLITIVTWMMPLIIGCLFSCMSALTVSTGDGALETPLFYEVANKNLFFFFFFLTKLPGSTNYSKAFCFLQPSRPMYGTCADCKYRFPS